MSEEIEIIDSRVKITLVGNGRIISLRDLKVHERVYTSSTSRKVNLTTGKHFAGFEVNYLLLVHITNDKKKMINYSHIIRIYR